MTILIGLTGGIASGKSSVTNHLRGLGYTVVDADEASREAVVPGSYTLSLIVKRFSSRVPDLLLPDGRLNRAALGAHVFSDHEERKALNAIIGPSIFMILMKQLFYAWLIGTRIVVLDAPTLFETKSFVPLCREILVVYVSEATQLKRLMDRDGSTQVEAMKRIQSQMTLEEKLKQPNVVPISNDGTPEELAARVDDLHRRLQRDYPVRSWRTLMSGVGILTSAGVVVCGVVAMRRLA